MEDNEDRVGEEDEEVSVGGGEDDDEWVRVNMNFEKKECRSYELSVSYWMSFSFFFVEEDVCQSFSGPYKTLKLLTDDEFKQWLITTSYKLPKMQSSDHTLPIMIRNPWCGSHLCVMDCVNWEKKKFSCRSSRTPTFDREYFFAEVDPREGGGKTSSSISP